MLKKTITICFAAALLISCEGSDTKSDETSTTSAETAQTPAYQEGLALVAKSDCLTCHKIAEASTGPSYEAIAAKYADNTETITLLSGKIINGGVGVWGQVPMSAHPNVTKEDAEKMVKYILLLKK